MKASDVVAILELTVDSTFIPWSESRNAKEDRPSLNWHVTIKHKGREILSTDYSAGYGHCPASKASVKAMGNQNSVMRDAHIRWECEHGYESAPSSNLNTIYCRGKPLTPKPLDVLSSLVLDAAALDCRDFEEWASDLGYDTDSRKAEAIYRACLDIGLKMRAALGDANLQNLREAFQDY
jgi:hypothetical protein